MTKISELIVFVKPYNVNIVVEAIAPAPTRSDHTHFYVPEIELVDPPTGPTITFVDIFEHLCRLLSQTGVDVLFETAKQDGETVLKRIDVQKRAGHSLSPTQQDPGSNVWHWSASLDKTNANAKIDGVALDGLLALSKAQLQKLARVEFYFGQANNP